MQALANNPQPNDDEALAMPLWLKWAFLVVIVVAVIMGLLV